MAPLTVINDIHIGVQRSAGTTPTSAWALRQYVLSQYQLLLEGCYTDLLINGDLFDGYSINYTDLLAAFSATTKWLQKAKFRLYLSAGNHDLSTNSTKLSSFEFFATLLKELVPDRVTVIKGSADIGYGRYVISHVPNQDMFNLELERVPADCKWLFLHCNYDNFFAQQSDNSLNLSATAAANICKNGTNIVLGHEHQQRKIDHEGGSVYIVGNQIPSSVADCLNNDFKQLAMINADKLETMKTCLIADEYAEIDWKELSQFDGKQRFIRVSGQASAAEAADVVSLISRYRSKSTAFVISNAVKVLTDEGSIDLADSAEELKSFDVLAALLEMLTADEAAVVKSVLEVGND